MTGWKPVPLLASPHLSLREIEIRATHEIMAARAAQLALLVDQLVAALRAKPPVLAGNITVRRCRASLI